MDSSAGGWVRGDQACRADVGLVHVVAQHVVDRGVGAVDRQVGEDGAAESADLGLRACTYALVVEVGDLLAQVVVLEQLRAPLVGLGLRQPASPPVTHLVKQRSPEYLVPFRF
ncbi:hypothetical protein V2S66_19165 [Streptomyces sp. V4-01]|uniref:Uncharacterized protein n=1 Tax=Actinacidiphila polyblastidii TaxID=3110430 RepID=A0ABU7PE44_9ACTN|nr:hypothetical protein [Streptomyces sp. V4-01]